MATIAARKRERGAKMASYIYEECGDKYVKKYIIDAGNLTSVHVLGVSYFLKMAISGVASKRQY